jgi:putative urate catabolism protein
MPELYPRNMKGYGRAIPDPQWPARALVAVQFVLNYEEGGENNILHGDSASEAFLSEIVGAAAWMGQRHWNMESIYEYGARSGFWRLHKIFTARNVPLTVFGVAIALQRSPDQVAAMKEAGWEIASHGLKWVEHKDMTEDAERASIAEAIRIHTEITGERPSGWYTGRCSMNTTKLVMQESGFMYSSDDYSDDLPYWLPKMDGGRHLIIPYTLDANDMRFATPQGFNTGEHFYQYLKDSFDCLYAEGKAGSPKMMSIGLHCRLAGRPGRALGLVKFIEYVLAHEKVWVPTRLDIAKHWHEKF